MLKVRYVLGACAIALLLTGCASTQTYYPTTGYNTGYGCGQRYACGVRTLLYCQDGICYYTDGSSFTYPDGSHVISNSGIIPQ